MSVQKFHGTINTDGVKDERGIETPSLSATGEVSGQTGVFTESVSAPAFTGDLTGNVTGDLTGNVTGDLTGTAARATADAEGNVIPTTYATKEELAEETSARETAESNLSKGITDEATARAAAIEDIVDGTTIVGKATADGNGNNISSTYATQTALTSGLAGKANTSGSYPSLSVGTATNATNATYASNINTAAVSSSPWSNSSVFLSSRTINTANPHNNDRMWAMSRLLGWPPSSNSDDLLFVSAMYVSGTGSEGGRCVTGSVIVDPPTRTLTILTDTDKGFRWNFTEEADTPLKFTVFGEAQLPTLPAQITITVLGFSEA